MRAPSPGWCGRAGDTNRSPVATVQMRTPPSEPPVASSVPSGLNATALRSVLRVQQRHARVCPCPHATERLHPAFPLGGGDEASVGRELDVLDSHFRKHADQAAVRRRTARRACGRPPTADRSQAVRLAARHSPGRRGASSSPGLLRAGRARAGRRGRARPRAPARRHGQTGADVPDLRERPAGRAVTVRASGPEVDRVHRRVRATSVAIDETGARVDDEHALRPSPAASRSPVAAESATARTVAGCAGPSAAGRRRGPAAARPPRPCPARAARPEREPDAPVRVDRQLLERRRVERAGLRVPRLRVRPSTRSESAQTARPATTRERGEATLRARADGGGVGARPRAPARAALGALPRARSARRARRGRSRSECRRRRRCATMRLVASAFAAPAERVLRRRRRTRARSAAPCAIFVPDGVTRCSNMLAATSCSAGRQRRRARGRDGRGRSCSAPPSAWSVVEPQRLRARPALLAPRAARMHELEVRRSRSGRRPARRPARPPSRPRRPRRARPRRAPARSRPRSSGRRARVPALDRPDDRRAGCIAIEMVEAQRVARTGSGSRALKASSLRERVLAQRDEQVRRAGPPQDASGNSRASDPGAVVAVVVEEVLLDLVEDDDTPRLRPRGVVGEALEIDPRPRVGGRDDRPVVRPEMRAARARLRPASSELLPTPLGP